MLRGLKWNGGPPYNDGPRKKIVMHEVIFSINSRINQWFTWRFHIHILKKDVSVPFQDVFFGTPPPPPTKKKKQGTVHLPLASFCLSSEVGSLWRPHFNGGSWKLKNGRFFGVPLGRIILASWWFELFFIFTPTFGNDLFDSYFSEAIFGIYVRFLGCSSVMRKAIKNFWHTCS